MTASFPGPSTEPSLSGQELYDSIYDRGREAAREELEDVLRRLENHPYLYSSCRGVIKLAVRDIRNELDGKGRL